MTGATGKRLEFREGMPRAEVVKTLGQPESKTTDVKGEHRYEFRHRDLKIAYSESYRYRGKINSIDEGGGQAIMNALTLGTGEIILIPLTTIDIAKRSLETHEIHVFYSDKDTVVGFLISPR